MIRRIFDDFTRFEKEMGCEQNCSANIRYFGAIFGDKCNGNRCRFDEIAFIFAVKRNSPTDQQDIEELFSAYEITLFEWYFYYMEDISNNVRLGDTVNIIARFINTESLSDKDKAEIVSFRLQNKAREK